MASTSANCTILIARTREKVRHANEIAQMTIVQTPPTEPLRRGVGIMLLNHKGYVFVGRRSDVSDAAWQMPQGGIDPGETPYGAALREMREELGTSNAEVIVTTHDWLSYELPPELLNRIPPPRFRGQTQQWFLMRFRGTDDEINVSTEHSEFSAWKWVAPEDLLDLIVPFKRELYRCVLKEFQPYLPAHRANSVP
jgi:putative (di)nucleoside polyphosphate hydrolase